MVSASWPTHSVRTVVFPNPEEKGALDALEVAQLSGRKVRIAAKIGPPLDAEAQQIAEAFASREWSCADTRYLGGGVNSRGEFYAYVTIDDDGGEQWWVFTTLDKKVIAIE